MPNTVLAVSRSDSEKQSRLWLITYTDTHNVTEISVLCTYPA